MSIANFDADHFRASNELKGRNYGDAQIKIIAKNINRAVMDLRKAGYKAYAVRMGGEKFTLMSTAPKDILHKKMLEMSAKTKQEMLSTLSDAEKAKMAEHIAKTKYADASMEDLKKMHGRGNFELDRQNPTATSERINSFQIHNVFDVTQKGNLSIEAKKLFG